MREIAAKKILRESWIGQSERYDIAERAGAKFRTELAVAPKVIDGNLKEKMTQIHHTKRLIGVQTDRLRKQTRGLGKDAKTLDALSAKALSKLKEAGDLQNFAEIIDINIRVLEETVRLKQARSETRN